MKIGDIVICVKPNHNTKLNRKYKITHIDRYRGNVYYDVVDTVTGEILFGLCDSRFALAPKEISTKQNMKLKCINSANSNSLSLGRIYTKVDTNEHGNISVKDSNGRVLQHYYKPDRFEEVKEDPTFDISQEYQTRGGDKVKIYAIGDDADYPIVGTVFIDGKWRNESWSRDGKYINDQDEVNSLDLIKVRPKYYPFDEVDGVCINREDQTVEFEAYAYSFEDILKIAKEINDQA